MQQGSVTHKGYSQHDVRKEKQKEIPNLAQGGQSHLHNARAKSSRANHFHGILNRSSLPVLLGSSHTEEPMLASTAEVVRALKKFNNWTTAAPHGIPPSVLKVDLCVTESSTAVESIW